MNKKVLASLLIGLILSVATIFVSRNTFPPSVNLSSCDHIATTHHGLPLSFFDRTNDDEFLGGNNNPCLIGSDDGGKFLIVNYLIDLLIWSGVTYAGIILINYVRSKTT